MQTFRVSDDNVREVEARKKYSTSAYNRADGVLKYANDKGYCNQGEIRAAVYALNLSAQPGDQILNGRMTYTVVSVDADTITMRSDKCPTYRDSAEYTVRWRLHGEPRQPRQPRKSEPTVAMSEPTVVYEPEPMVSTATPAAPSVVVDTSKLPTADDVVALLNQIAQQSLTDKQAELDELTAKYNEQLAELTTFRQRCDELEYELKLAKQVGAVAYKPGGACDIKHAQFDEVACYVQQGRNVLLIGKAGTGKTELAKAIARSLGIEYVTMSALVDKSEITGYVSPHSGTLLETAVYIAMKYGKMLILDEYDCSYPEAAKYVNEVLANRSFTFPNGELVEAHPNFRVIACANTNGEGATSAYNAAFKLDASTKDRFEMIEIEYMYEIDLKCANGDTELVEFARELRKLFDTDKQNNTYVMSPRRISGIVAGLPLGIEKAVRNAIFNHMNADDAKRIVGNLRGTTKYHEAARKVVMSL